MTIPLTREEALRQIAELQRRIASLPKNNHPAPIERGMLFRHESGDLYLVVRSGSDGLDLRNTSSGNAWLNGKGFDGDENEFEYLGHAKDLLVLKTDKPEVVVTDEMAMKAFNLYTGIPGAVSAMKHVLTLALNGKL